MKKSSMALLAVLLTLSAFFRFYRLFQLMPFTIDEEYVSQLAWTIKQDFHIIWIGVSAGSTNYYLGPGYIYLTTVLYHISQGNPIVLGIFSSLLGIATTLILFWFTKSISNEKVAQAAALVYAANTYIALYDRRYWPPPLGLMGLLILWTIIAAYKKPTWYIATAALIGFSLHLHLSLLLFVPFFLVALYTTLRQKKITWHITLGMIGAYLAITSPLLVYDVLHNADNLKAPFALVTSQGGSLLPSLKTHIMLAFGVLTKLWSSTVSMNSFDSLIYLFLSLMALVLMFRTPQYRSIRYVGFVIIAYLCVFILYPGRIQEYYLAGILPFMCIAIGLLFTTMPKVARVLLVGAYITIQALSLYTVIEPQSLQAKLKLIHEVQQVTHKDPITVTTKEDYRLNGGWHFLFMTQGTLVVEGSAQPLFGWIYQQYEPRTPKAKHQVVIEYTDTGFHYTL
ncbi:MAG: glycosyltransferase family 39 protein [Candidatus Roizmanbacteria bacterium]|nr:glycosyltransferase family 39 protein [Candidatus Roizmanbacteria bacterium]